MDVHLFSDECFLKMIEHLHILLFQHFYRIIFLKIDPNMDMDGNVNGKNFPKGSQTHHP